jgi:hypothetical protein
MNGAISRKQRRGKIENMANPESDVEKLQLSLAGAALSLLACEEKIVCLV